MTPTMPEAAVFAAAKAITGPLRDPTEWELEQFKCSLTAALPFLQGVKVDPWVDTRLVRFDGTIAFGHGGFDFDRWESLRWEMHTRHGSFAVWKSDSNTWSMYGGKYGFLMLDRFSSEEEAKAEAEQIVISLDAEPSPRAQALEEAQHAVGSTVLMHRASDYEGLDSLEAYEAGQLNGLERAQASLRALSHPVSPDMGVEPPVEGGWLPIETVKRAQALAVSLRQCSIFVVADVGKHIAKSMTDAAEFLEALPQAPGVAV